MRIGFTGSRDGMTVRQVGELRRLLRILPVDEAHHGDCLGADKGFHDLVRYYKFTVSACADCRIVIHPPSDPKLRAFCQGATTLEPLPFIERNHRIVDAAELVVAAPSGPEKSQPRSGTWATVRYATGRRPVLILPWEDVALPRQAGIV